MIIKSRPTFDAKHAAACARMEREKNLEIRESKKLYELRRQLGSKKHEGRVGAKSRLAVMNAVATEGKEVLTDAGEGFWRDMQRRYHWQAEDGNWEDGSSANGRRNHFGVVKAKPHHSVGFCVNMRPEKCWLGKMCAVKPCPKSITESQSSSMILSTSKPHCSKYSPTPSGHSTVLILGLSALIVG